jgi:hypothetical protein
MIDRNEAIAQARLHVPGLEIIEERVVERRRGWVIPVGKSGLKPPGILHGGIFVDKENGALYELPTARKEAWLDTYDATGAPPKPLERWSYVGGLKPTATRPKRPLGGLRKR